MPEDPLPDSSLPARAPRDASTSAAARLTAQRADHAAHAARVREVISARATTATIVDIGQAHAADEHPAISASLHEASVSHPGPAPHSPAVSTAVSTSMMLGERPIPRGPQAAAVIPGRRSPTDRAWSLDLDAFQMLETGGYSAPWKGTELCSPLFLNTSGLTTLVQDVRGHCTDNHVSLRYVLNHLLQICPTTPLQSMCLSPSSAILGLHHTALLLQQYYHAQRSLMLQLVFQADAIIHIEHGLLKHFRCLRIQVGTFLSGSYRAVACVFLARLRTLGTLHSCQMYRHVPWTVICSLT